MNGETIGAEVLTTSSNQIAVRKGVVSYSERDYQTNL